MNSYLDNDFQLIQENDSKLCPSCSSLCCLPNICSCILFPFKLCMGLTWIGSCGFFFYLGNLYHQEPQTHKVSQRVRNLAFYKKSNAAFGDLN